MKITIELDDATDHQIQQSTGEETESKAIARIIDQYLLEQRKDALIARALSGQTDYSMTNDELEAWLADGTD